MSGKLDKTHSARGGRMDIGITNQALETVMKPPRTLETIYWNDEGDAAIRWLIGEIDYGHMDETKDRLRRSSLEEIREWASYTRNLHLRDLVDLTLAGGTEDSLPMNPALGPGDRLVAICGAAALMSLSRTAAVAGGAVCGLDAHFVVTLKGQQLDVVVSPTTTTATLREDPSATTSWATSIGSAGANKIITLAQKGQP